ncbi:MAG: hypothetical protein Q7S17_11655 [Xanthobacteraceae bacterium]|nr:hypothetical protein [Xanthobacteraceae bacterium]
MKMHLKSAFLAVSLLGLSVGVAAAFPASVRVTTEIYWGPGPEFPVAEEISAGTEVDVRRCSDDWCEIAWEDEVAFIPRWALALGGGSVPFIGAFSDYEVSGSYVYGPSFAYRIFGDRHSRRESRADRHSRNESRAVRHRREDSRLIDQRRLLKQQKFQKLKIQTKDTKQPLILTPGVEPRTLKKDTKKDTKKDIRLEIKKDTKTEIKRDTKTEFKPVIKKDIKTEIKKDTKTEFKAIKKDTTQPVTRSPTTTTKPTTTTTKTPPAKEKGKEKGRD